MIRSTDNVFMSSLTMLTEVKHEIDTSEFMNCGLRLDVVFQCINVSVEHSIGVISLMAAVLPIPAMVVLRAQYEAVTRAYWLLYIATNNQIMKINFNWTNEEQWLSDKFPMITEMLDKLSKADLPAKGNIQHLVEFKKYHLKALNSLVHTGKHAFIRSSLGFDPSMIDTLMRQSNNLVSAAVHIMFKHSIPDKQHFLLGLHEKYRECFYMEQDVDPNMKATIDARFK